METPDPLAMMQPLWEAPYHQLPPASDCSPGRGPLFLCLGRAPPAGGNEPWGSARLGSRGGDGWRGHFRAHPLPPSCCSPARGHPRGQQQPPSALSSPRLPQELPPRFCASLSTSKPRPHRVCKERRLGLLPAPAAGGFLQQVALWADGPAKAAAVGGSLPLGRRGSELGCFEATKGDGTGCPAQDIPGGLEPRSSQSWR